MLASIPILFCSPLKVASHPAAYVTTLSESTCESLFRFHNTTFGKVGAPLLPAVCCLPHTPSLLPTCCQLLSTRVNSCQLMSTHVKSCRNSCQIMSTHVHSCQRMSTAAWPAHCCLLPTICCLLPAACCLSTAAPFCCQLLSATCMLPVAFPCRLLRLLPDELAVCCCLLLPACASDICWHMHLHRG